MRQLREIARRARALGAQIDPADVLVVVGLLLLGAGFWQLSHALALVIVGSVVVFYALPPRPPFIDRPARKRDTGSAS